MTQDEIKTRATEIKDKIEALHLELGILRNELIALRRVCLHPNAKYIGQYLNCPDCGRVEAR